MVVTDNSGAEVYNAMKKNELEIAHNRRIDEHYRNKHISLANSLAQAKNKTSLIESKIEFLAIYKLAEEKFQVDKIDSRGRTYKVNAVSMGTREIRELICRKGGSLYSDLEKVAIELKNKLYIYRNPGEDQFVMKSLYGDVTYDNGKLTIEFNPETEYLFTELQSQFVKMQLEICFKFKTNGGFQLYKILSSKIYDLPKVDLSKPQSEQEAKIITTSLSELRLQLGYVDLNIPEIRKEGSKKHPDLDKMNRLEKKPKYKRWSDFNARVIQPGITECNEMSDIYIDYVEKGCGAHGKVEDIVIRVQRNVKYATKRAGEESATKPNKPVVVLSPEEREDFWDEVITLTGCKIKDAREVAEHYSYDLELIKEKWELRPAKLESFVGWMKKALDENYQPSTAKSGSKKKNNFNNFNQRTYDFEELEKDAFI